MIHTVNCLLLSIFQLAAITMNLSSGKTFPKFNILEIPLFLLVFYLTRSVLMKIRQCSKRKLIPAIVIGILFSFFILAGHSIDTAGDLSEMSFAGGKAVKTIVSLSGYALFFFFCAQFLFFSADKWPDRMKESSDPKTGLLKRCLKIFESHPFLFSFLLLSVCTLPGIIISYPGIMTGDSYFQIAQGYGLENKKDWAVFSPPKPELYRTIEGKSVRIDTKLSNYHPIAHTMLLHSFMMLGNVMFRSDNFGLFMLVLFQNLLLNSVLAYGIKILRSEFDLSSGCCLLFLTYFIFHPGIRAQMTAVSKEGIYISFLILCIIEIAALVSNSLYSQRGRTILLLAAGICGAVIFRNEGKFLLSLSFFFLIMLVPGRRKIFAFLLTGTVLFAVFYEAVLLPTLNIAPGTVREMLSVPFQQTARYVRDAGESVTEEERRNIGRVLEYDVLAERYNPNNADNVKGTFNYSATISDLKRYFFTWLDMLFKRPDIYILATMSNYYQYFYPYSAEINYFNFDFGASEMWLTNRDCAEIGLNLHFPRSFSGVRRAYESFRNGLSSLPLIRCVWVSALYIWGLFIYTAYCIYRQDMKAIAPAVPMLVQIIVFITGPTNGYYSRYIFLLKACLPVIVLFGAAIMKENSIMSGLNDNAVVKKKNSDGIRDP